MSRYDIKETADRIRAQRTICGYTQAQAARRLEIDRRSMSHIENGTKGCSVDLLIRIAEAYGVTLDYLLLGKSADSKIVKDRLDELIRQLTSMRNSLDVV